MRLHGSLADDERRGHPAGDRCNSGGAALLRHYRWWAQLLAAVVAILALIFLYQAIDAVLKGLFGDVGPSWLADELGIVATGALCLVGGVLLGRAVGMPRHGALPAPRPPALE